MFSIFVKLVEIIKIPIGKLMTLIIYLLYYSVAIVTLFFHFTGQLERWGMEWLVLVLAVTVFPVVIYL